MSGSTLQEGDTVTLVLSKGPMKGNIPNVVGLTLGEAGNILKENKLSLGNIKYEYSDTYNNGIVISQDPKSGSENNQEWGTVNVVVSKGQERRSRSTASTQDNTTSGNTGGDTSGNTGGNTSGSTGEDVSGSNWWRYRLKYWGRCNGSGRYKGNGGIQVEALVEIQVDARRRYNGSLVANNIAE